MFLCVMQSSFSAAGANAVTSHLTADTSLTHSEYSDKVLILSAAFLLAHTFLHSWFSVPTAIMIKSTRFE